MSHSVRLFHDGIVRWYPCNTYFDAVMLVHALWTTYGTNSATIWKGDEQVS